MWVSKRRWNELEGRLEFLEKQVRNKAEKDVVFLLHTHLSAWDKETRVPLHELVRELMRCVGLRVKAVPARLAGYELEHEKREAPPKN